MAKVVDFRTIKHDDEPEMLMVPKGGYLNLLLELENGLIERKTEIPDTVPEEMKGEFLAYLKKHILQEVIKDANEIAQKEVVAVDPNIAFNITVYPQKVEGSILVTKASVGVICVVRAVNDTYFED